ncbi:GIY-YIG nuclease family protein [Clostridium perfringens]|uniref:GIY-YIG nuclease family protein n=1 Tax=Clostridium perfringens TaxID=1502 RepID=UPI003BAC76FB
MQKELKIRFNKILSDIIKIYGKDDFDEKYVLRKIKNMNKSYVYILYNKDTKLYKIGCTKNVKQRLKQIENTFRTTIGIEPRLKLFAIIECFDNMNFKMEKYLHKCFAEHRKYGEWFDLEREEYFYDIFDCINNSNEIRKFNILDWITITDFINIYKKEKYYLDFEEIAKLNIMKNKYDIDKRILDRINFDKALVETINYYLEKTLKIS